MQQYPRRYLVAALLLVVGGAMVNAIWLNRPTEASYTASFDKVPLAVGSFKGEVLPVEKRIYAYLDADAVEEIEYTGPRGQTAHLSLVYGKDWRALHSPLSCYPQQGWSVDEKRIVELPAPPGCPHPGPLQATLMRVHKERQALLALYLFPHKGGTEADWVKQSWAVARSPRGTGGIIMALSTPIGGGDADAALELLTQLLDAAYGPATEFWYR